MGCFLACFGFSKKRKRRRPANKVSCGDQKQGSYKPLDSDVKTDLFSNSSESEISSKGKKRSSLKTKKKVSFNLHVKTYEPLPHVDYTSYFSESDEDNCEENKEETESTCNDSISENFKTGTVPSNYRYQNLREGYDEDDDIELEESDLDDYESDDDEDEILSEEELSDHPGSLSMEETDKRVVSDKLGEDKNDNFMPLVASLDQELKKLGLNTKATRDRSQYVFSVLNPVENLTQWKAVKARIPQPLKQKRKENVGSHLDHKPNSSQTKPLMQETAVDTSLSNWLVSCK